MADAPGIWLAEQAGTTNPGAGKGAYWVKNTAPTTPWFTGDTDVDMEIGRGYETGTWTPNIWDDSHSSSEGQTYSSQVGYYRKAGRHVIVFFDVTVTSLGTLGTGAQAKLGPLPFGVSSTTGSGVAAFGSGHSQSFEYNIRVGAGNNRVWFGRGQSTGTNEWFYLLRWSDDGRVIGSCTYEATL